MMTCKECKPHTHAVKDGRVVLATELCAKHALTDRLAERLMSIQYAYYTAKTAELLAEYDSAKNQEKQS